MSRFLTKLRTVRYGKKRWKLTDPLIYASKLAGNITVPAGFITDMASVPRIPLAYWLAGDTAHEAAVIHDYLYTSHKHPRDVADAVFLEAMKAMGEPFIRRYAMYTAVRLFGAAPYMADGRKGRRK